ARKKYLWRFSKKLAVAVVTGQSPPARHDDGSGWKSHRCCGGLGGDGGVWMVMAAGMWCGDRRHDDDEGSGGAAVVVAVV
nr:hypothetical protein [Tanacetum cinerariifolium]